MMLDERKKQILLAIIQDYIATAEPIGSRTIARKYKLGVSPATIRNEMADLEELGYIEQPHTSAGRVPSDLGYRYYVDCLMKKSKLTKNEKDAITRGLATRVNEVAQVIEQTNRILSSLTNYTTVVLGPNTGGAIKHVQIIPLEGGKALVVVVTSVGVVRNRMIDIAESLTPADLEHISRVLNAKLQGLTLESIKMTLIREIYSELAKNEHIFDAAMDLLQGTLNLNSEEKVYLAGTLNIFNQPEFRDINKVKTLLSLLEQDSLLRNLLKESSKNEAGVTIKIGGENELEGFKECSMITASYQIEGEVVGAIGLIGPTRMHYDKAVAMVEFVTQYLSEVLHDYYKKR
ncbi:heat-inducible transcriptional repressor HrcA [Thermincola ferriacetica]